MSEVLAHQGRALTPEETEELLRDRLGEHVQRAVTEYGVFTMWIAPEGWLEAARRCRDERLLAYDMFDSLFGVDAREDGFDVVAVLYSTSTGNRIALRARCAGGREAPSLPSITEVYRGADWMERETYDMFGIDFPGHPGLEPRILTVENFEGWPLRKDFHLAARVAKPWPGVAEPVELDEDGNKIERERSIGDAPGPYELDKAMAEQAKVVNAPPAPAVEAEPEPAEAATGQQEEPATTAVADEGAATDAAPEQDPAARAKAKAEERRKRQAEARAAKAQARAGKVKEAQGGPSAAEAAPAAEAEAPVAGEPAPEPVVEQPSAPEAAPEVVSEEDGDVDPRVAARRKRQAEARAARAKARAEKAGGESAPAAPAAEPAPTSEAAPVEATTETVTEAAPEAPAPQDPAEPTSDEPVGSDTPAEAAPEIPEAEEQPASDDPAAAARAKAEARRKRQAEVRAARAKARAEKAEQQSETDGEGDA
ncbi:MAG: NADH-quinone oxidoreductase subunit C [Nitriliruptor sp.]|nr:MAG: NADH-quinone oxidoreductase subunit C [Nitriliruptor sp.]